MVMFLCIICTQFEVVDLLESLTLSVISGRNLMYLMHSEGHFSKFYN